MPKFLKLKIRGTFGGLFEYSAGQNDTFPKYFWSLCFKTQKCRWGLNKIILWLCNLTPILEKRVHQLMFLKLYKLPSTYIRLMAKILFLDPSCVQTYRTNLHKIDQIHKSKRWQPFQKRQPTKDTALTHHMYQPT